MEKIRFKNDREVLEALIDNKKISCDGWEEHEYTHLKNGMLIGENGQKKCTLFSLFNEYYIWQPPKEHGIRIAKGALTQSNKQVEAGKKFEVIQEDEKV